LPNSTPTSASPAASNLQTPEQAISGLIAEVKTLRSLVLEQRQERDDLQSALDTEKAFSASLEKSYAAAEREISTLNRSIDHLDKAIALNEKTIGLVEKQRDEAKADAKRSRKHAMLATAIAVFSLLKLTRIAF
jgi:septal ring factor EnvC (AmiA/AmiB activator)